jgi:hypothetical protein
MRTLFKACSLVLLSVLTMACNRREEDMPGDQGQPQYYTTADETVKNAKAAFLAALQYNKDINLGVDSATVARSTPGTPVRRVELDFAKLLTADPAAGFDALVKSEKSTVVPLLSGDSVVTIVEVRREDRGWKLVGLAGKDIADDLSAVLRAVGNTPQSQTTLYDVPNLQTKVYGVKSAGGETLFANYKDRFDIRKGVSAAALIPVLKADAVAFQSKYGEALKNQRLVR